MAESVLIARSQSPSLAAAAIGGNSSREGECLMRAVPS